MGRGEGEEGEREGRGRGISEYIIITLQIVLNFILWLSRLKLNTIAQVQKSQDVEEEAMDMVPWDS